MVENKQLSGSLKNRHLIQLKNVTLRVRDTFLLSGTCWKIDQGQHWAILGPNGAGKTTLVKALAGEVPVVKGTLSACGDQSTAVRAEYVSFEQHQRLMVREEQRDEFRHFSGHLNGITTVREILAEGKEPPEKKSAAVERVAAGLNIQHWAEVSGLYRPAKCAKSRLQGCCSMLRKL
jgi:ABC-type molybdenum transport system ATPase subunit/photorepair protein PhrA